MLLLGEVYITSSLGLFTLNSVAVRWEGKRAQRGNKVLSSTLLLNLQTFSDEKRLFDNNQILITELRIFLSKTLSATIALNQLSEVLKCTNRFKYSCVSYHYFSFHFNMLQASCLLVKACLHIINPLWPLLGSTE